MKKILHGAFRWKDRFPFISQRNDPIRKYSYLQAKKFALVPHLRAVQIICQNFITETSQLSPIIELPIFGVYNATKMTAATSVGK